MRWIGGDGGKRGEGLVRMKMLWEGGGGVDKKVEKKMGRR